MSEIKAGKLFASSTDTVWGLIGRPSEDTYEAIYEIKARDKSKPLILFPKSIEIFKKYCKIESELLDNLIKEHWPGALTVIVSCSEDLPTWLNPEFDSVGFRIPNSPSIEKIFKETGEEFLLSTSANLSGEEVVKDYEEALFEFVDKVDLVIEPQKKETAAGTASTIIKLEDNGELKVLREGDIKINAVA